nr:endo-1,3-alpha-glucanase family glycosylhydrolase [uncultured Rhodoferax sp.]
MDVSRQGLYGPSYVAPISSSKADTGPKELPNKHMPSHVAYLDASRYYIDWFKMGKPPTISQDKLFYFYRTHPKTQDAEVSVGGVGGMAKPRGVANLKDNVFVSAFLTQAG